MVGKDKKGGASYLRKWWGWLVSILFKILRWIFSVEGVSLLFTGGLMVFVVYEFFWWQTTEFFEVENVKNAKSSQLLILTLGSIGAACGLILAARRSAKFSEQVDTAQKQVGIAQKQLEIAQKQADTGQKQLFNEQLGRGAELLANKEMVVRQTGIRVFEDFAERTPEQIKLIMQIIHDFVHANASSSSKGQKRLDIALGIRTLGSLYNEVDKSDGSDGFRKLLDFSRCHLEGLNFTETELQGADFWRAKLQGVRFMGAQLQGVRFMGAQLKEADFECANLQEADFNDAKLQEARLIAAQLQGANLISANLQGVDFWQANLQGVEFWGANLQGANFKVAQLQGAQFLDAQLQRTDFNGAQLQWADCIAADFSDAKNLTEEQVKGMIFKVDAPPKLPDGLEQFLDKKRGYKFEKDSNNESDFNYYFVDSDAEWSGKRVDEWVREYLASIREPEDA